MYGYHTGEECQALGRGIGYIPLSVFGNPLLKFGNMNIIFFFLCQEKNQAVPYHQRGRLDRILGEGEFGKDLLDRETEKTDQGS